MNARVVMPSLMALWCILALAGWGCAGRVPRPNALCADGGSAGSRVDADRGLYWSTCVYDDDVIVRIVDPSGRRASSDGKDNEIPTLGLCPIPPMGSVIGFRIDNASYGVYLIEVFAPTERDVTVEVGGGGLGVGLCGQTISGRFQESGCLTWVVRFRPAAGDTGCAIDSGEPRHDADCSGWR
jgi:hypothetical protein